MPTLWHVGDRCEVSGKPGTIRFMGKTQFSAGEWVGVELDTHEGKNDGKVNDVEYFPCRPGHGLFVRKVQLRKGKTGKAASAAAASTAGVRSDGKSAAKPATRSSARTTRAAAAVKATTPSTPPAASGKECTRNDSDRCSPPTSVVNDSDGKLAKEEENKKETEKEKGETAQAAAERSEEREKNAEEAPAPSRSSGTPPREPGAIETAAVSTNGEEQVASESRDSHSTVSPSPEDAKQPTEAAALDRSVTSPLLSGASESIGGGAPPKSSPSEHEAKASGTWTPSKTASGVAGSTSSSKPAPWMSTAKKKEKEALSPPPGTRTAAPTAVAAADPATADAATADVAAREDGHLTASADAPSLLAVPAPNASGDDSSHDSSSTVGGLGLGGGGGKVASAEAVAAAAKEVGQVRAMHREVLEREEGLRGERDRAQAAAAAATARIGKAEADAAAALARAAAAEESAALKKVEAEAAVAAAVAAAAEEGAKAEAAVAAAAEKVQMAEAKQKAAEEAKDVAEARATSVENGAASREAAVKTAEARMKAAEDASAAAAAALRKERAKFHIELEGEKAARLLLVSEREKMAQNAARDSPSSKLLTERSERTGRRDDYDDNGDGDYDLIMAKKTAEMISKSLESRCDRLERELKDALNSKENVELELEDVSLRVEELELELETIKETRALEVEILGTAGDSSVVGPATAHGRGDMQVEDDGDFDYDVFDDENVKHEGDANNQTASDGAKWREKSTALKKELKDANKTIVTLGEEKEHLASVLRMLHDRSTAEKSSLESQLATARQEAEKGAAAMGERDSLKAEKIENDELIAVLKERLEDATGNDEFIEELMEEKLDFMDSEAVLKKQIELQKEQLRDAAETQALFEENEELLKEELAWCTDRGDDDVEAIEKMTDLAAAAESKAEQLEAELGRQRDRLLQVNMERHDLEERLDVARRNFADLQELNAEALVDQATVRRSQQKAEQWHLKAAMAMLAAAESKARLVRLQVLLPPNFLAIAVDEAVAHSQHQLKRLLPAPPLVTSLPLDRELEQEKQEEQRKRQQEWEKEQREGLAWYRHPMSACAALLANGHDETKVVDAELSLARILSKAAFLATHLKKRSSVALATAVASGKACERAAAQSLRRRRRAAKARATALEQQREQQRLQLEQKRGRRGQAPNTSAASSRGSSRGDHAPVTANAAALTEKEIDGLKVAQLKEELSRRGESTAGLKSVLAARLKTIVAQAAASAAEAESATTNAEAGSATVVGGEGGLSEEEDDEDDFQSAEEEEDDNDEDGALEIGGKVDHTRRCQDEEHDPNGLKGLARAISSVTSAGATAEQWSKPMTFLLPSLLKGILSLRQLLLVATSTAKNFKQQVAPGNAGGQNADGRAYETPSRRAAAVATAAIGAALRFEHIVDEATAVLWERDDAAASSLLSASGGEGRGPLAERVIAACPPESLSGTTDELAKCAAASWMFGGSGQAEQYQIEAAASSSPDGKSEEGGGEREIDSSTSSWQSYILSLHALHTSAAVSALRLAGAISRRYLSFDDTSNSSEQNDDGGKGGSNVGGIGDLGNFDIGNEDFDLMQREVQAMRKRNTLLKGIAAVAQEMDQFRVACEGTRATHAATSEPSARQGDETDDESEMSSDISLVRSLGGFVHDASPSSCFSSIDIIGPLVPAMEAAIDTLRRPVSDLEQKVDAVANDETRDADHEGAAKKTKEGPEAEDELDAQAEGQQSSHLDEADAALTNCISVANLLYSFVIEPNAIVAASKAETAASLSTSAKGAPAVELSRHRPLPIFGQNGSLLPSIPPCVKLFEARGGWDTILKGVAGIVAPGSSLVSSENTGSSTSDDAMILFGESNRKIHDESDGRLLSDFASQRDPTAECLERAAAKIILGSSGGFTPGVPNEMMSGLEDGRSPSLSAAGARPSAQPPPSPLKRFAAAALQNKSSVEATAVTPAAARARAARTLLRHCMSSLGPCWRAARKELTDHQEETTRMERERRQALSARDRATQRVKDLETSLKAKTAEADEGAAEASKRADEVKELSAEKTDLERQLSEVTDELFSLRQEQKRSGKNAAKNSSSKTFFEQLSRKSAQNDQEPAQLKEVVALQEALRRTRSECHWLRQRQITSAMSRLRPLPKLHCQREAHCGTASLTANLEVYETTAEGGAGKTSEPVEQQLRPQNAEASSSSSSSSKPSPMESAANRLRDLERTLCRMQASTPLVSISGGVDGSSKPKAIELSSPNPSVTAPESPSGAPRVNDNKGDDAAERNGKDYAAQSARAQILAERIEAAQLAKAHGEACRDAFRLLQNKSFDTSNSSHELPEMSEFVSLVGRRKPYQSSCSAGEAEESAAPRLAARLILPPSYDNDSAEGSVLYPSTTTTKTVQVTHRDLKLIASSLLS